MQEGFKSKLKYYLRLFIVGNIVGIANIIPGVSGGTMAVVFGIYEDLMDALSNFIANKEKRKMYIYFLAVLFCGALLAILTFSKALAWAFDNFEMMTVYFFMGLILGSIPIIIKSHNDMKVNFVRMIYFIIGAGFVVILALHQDKTGTHSGTFNYQDYGIVDYIYFVVCGMIAASAMIVPGVSGSFILILLGVYRTVLDSVSGISDLILNHGLTPEIRVRLYLIGSLGIGVVAGILGFAKLMNWALKKYPANTMYIILGMLIGSIYQIYPGFEFNLNGLGSIITFLLGLIISLRFGVDKKDQLDS